METRELLFRYLKQILFLFFFLSFTIIVRSQTVAGIKANGVIMSNGDTIQVCIGGTVFYENIGQSFSLANWRFNNGTPNNFSSNNNTSVTITYNTAGIDTTFQKVALGSTVDSMFIFVKVNSVKPTAVFAFSPDNECGNTSFSFNSSGSSGSNLTYKWYFGDTATARIANPNHQYLDAIGTSGTKTYSSKLVVTNNLLCSDSITKTVTVKLIPDALLSNPDGGNVTYSPFNGVLTFRRCENTPSYVFKFRNATTTASINTLYTIQWGDSSPDSSFASWNNSTTITHQYNRGQSQMTVIVQGSTGCIGIRKYNIFLGTTPAGGFASLGNTSICAPNSLKFVISGTANNSNGTRYTVSVNDGSTPDVFDQPPPDTVSHTFTTGSCGNTSSNGATSYANSYRTTLDVENACGSASFNIIPIYVSGKPKARVSVSPADNVCVNSIVTISNISSYGGTIVPTGGNSSTCSNTGKQVWTISPSTGFTIPSSTLGSLNGSPNDGTAWTSGSSFFNIVFTSAGIYTIKLYVANDLCGIDSVVKTICVRTPPQASFSMDKHNSCGTDIATMINTSPTGGCLGDKYTWAVAFSDASGCNTTTGTGYAFTGGTNSSSQNPKIQFTNPGRYIVILTVTDNNSLTSCTSATTFDTFYVKAKPKITFNTLGAVCLGNPVNPIANVSNCYSTDALTYSWVMNGGTPSTATTLLPGSIMYTATGTYPLSLDATNECGTTTASLNAIITSLPAANAGADKTTCSGVAVSIGSAAFPGISYSWAPTSGLSNSGSASPNLTIIYTGPNTDTTITYIVTAFAGSNCSTSDTILVTVKKNPVVNISPNPVSICAGTSTTLTASGAATYQWLPVTGLSTAVSDITTASPLVSTNYTISGTGSNGCTASKSVLVTVIPQTNVNAGIDTVVCNSSSAVQLTATPSGGTWGGSSFINSLGIFNATAAGNGVYALTYKAGIAACTTTDTVLVTVTDIPVAIAGNDTVVCKSTLSFQLKGLPANGRWSGVSVTSGGLFAPSVAGTYSLIYTIGSGTCTGKDTMIITVNGGVTNNIISSNQTICTGVQPAIIKGQTAIGGNGTPTYQWQKSTDNINWTDIPSATSIDYTPGQLTQTTWYRRVASTLLCSGLHADNSAAVKITVNGNAIAVFNPTAITGCSPFTITSAIINVTLSTDVNEYRWYVNGNYIGSAQIFPVYTISNPGDSITVKLLAISKFGCINDSTERGFVTPKLPVISYIQSDTAGCSPVTISFTNTTGNPQQYTYLWNFGQGQTSNAVQPPAIVFPVNSNFGDTVYTISMKAISSCYTVESLKYVRAKSKPKILFTPDKTIGCSPMPVVFANTSRGSNITYTWNFDDGSLPVTTALATIQHIFTTGTKDTFNIKLVGKNECGTDSLMYAIITNPNSIALNFGVNGNEKLGCAPHAVHFINNTSGANSFTWNFGDGTTLNTVKGIDTITHIYTAAGTFTTTLSATNSCNDTSDIEIVTVALKPQVGFTASQVLTCLSDTLAFANTSTGSTYQWLFGDGLQSTQQNPKKVYQKAGIYTVKLINSNTYPQGFSCSDSAVTTIEIRDTLSAVIAVSDSVNACAPFRVTFLNKTLPLQNVQWNFGDGIFANGDSAVHTFTDTGTYFVRMTGRQSGGCYYKKIQPVKILVPAGRFSYSSGYICKGTSARFEVKGGNSTQYLFVFGDGDSALTNNTIAFHDYTVPGNYIPYVVLINGVCRLKLQTGDTVKLDKVTAGYSNRVQLNCGNTLVSFTDSSQSFFGVKSWFWNFGDGTTGIVKNPPKTYNQKGTYYVFLSATGVSGCVDTVTKVIDVTLRNYPASVIGADTVACTGKPLSFSALVLSQDSIANYNWTFGNGISSTAMNVITQFNNTGVFVNRLISNTVYGCADTVFKSIKVNPTPVIYAGEDTRICVGQSVQLLATGAPVWQWTPLQNLSCFACANPISNPVQTTQFIARGTNLLGCSASDTVIVNVVQPLQLKLLSTADTICVGQQIQLFATGASTYSWDPATGLPYGSKLPNPVVNPLITTQYRVIAGDGFHCFDDTAFVTVVVGPYPTISFKPDSHLVVAGSTVTIPTLLTNGPFKFFVWDPTTNLTCTNCDQPKAVINNNISYKLTATNIYGCSASDTINYQVICQEAQQVYIPNAFSPDGDGVNDIFMVRGKGIATVKHFRIFNRWGQLVFERNNFNANETQYGWDGRINGNPASPDVYVYTAEILCTAGAIYERKGNVTLVR